MKRPRLKRVPSGVVELLRLFVVVFFAGLGSLLGSHWDLGATAFAGLDGALIGVILGSFIGYAIGGVLGRSTIAAVDRTEERLRSVSAETRCMNTPLSRITAGAAGSGRRKGP